MNKFLSDLNERVQFTDWLNDYDGKIHPNVSDADRKLIKYISYAQIIVTLFMLVLFAILVSAAI